MSRLPRSAPTRADFDRLKAEYERLRRDVDELRELARQQRRELETQFIRIAQMQAILDETRLADQRRELASTIHSRPSN